jgi:hypothetical protein
MPTRGIGVPYRFQGEYGLKPDRVISVHFPKAVGTSLRLQFETLLGDSIFLDNDNDPLSVKSIQSVEIPSGKRLIHGHFHAGRYLSSDAYRMIFFAPSS